MSTRILFILIAVCGFNPALHAQTRSPHQVSLSVDNDTFTYPQKDEYYTNGLFLSYRFIWPQAFLLGKTPPVAELELSQQLFTPYSSDAPLVKYHDRPFAGLTSLKMGFHFFPCHESAFSSHIMISLLGPISGGEQIQKFYHRLFNYFQVNGWEYQIQNEVGVNLLLAYARAISYLFERHANIALQLNGSLGNTFTNVGMGMVFRFSFSSLPELSQSKFVHGDIYNNAKSENPKLIFFVNPKLNAVFYNATIQGELFANSSPVTFEIKPLLWQLETGFIMQIYPISFSYSLTLLSKEIDYWVTTSHRFGRLSASIDF